MYRCSLLLALLLSIVTVVAANSPERKIKITVLDFGAAPFARQIAEGLRTNLRASQDLSVADAEMTLAAARGNGYTGSLNLSLEEARDLGAAIESEYYFIGDAQTLRRSSSQKPVYYEAYCSVFLVSARTGKLIMWERPSFESDEATKAARQLSQHFEDAKLRQRYGDSIRHTLEEENKQRATIDPEPEAVIEAAPDDEKVAEQQGLRLPRPFRRFRPEYPDAAARADAEATVDVVVEIDADGETGKVTILRWAGFGLDEATVSTVRKMHFFPAMKNGAPVPMRVLLRYNFRKQPR
jgi:TonB family protein